MNKIFSITAFLLFTSQIYGCPYDKCNPLFDAKGSESPFGEEASLAPSARHPYPDHQYGAPAAVNQAPLWRHPSPEGVPMSYGSYQGAQALAFNQPPYFTSIPMGHGFAPFVGNQPVQSTSQAHGGIAMSRTKSYGTHQLSTRQIWYHPSALCNACKAHGVQQPEAGHTPPPFGWGAPTTTSSGQHNGAWDSGEATSATSAPAPILYYEESYSDSLSGGLTLVCDELYFPVQENPYPLQSDVPHVWAAHANERQEDGANAADPVTTFVEVKTSSHGVKRRRKAGEKSDVSKRAQHSSSPILVPEDKPGAGIPKSEQTTVLYNCGIRLLNETLCSKEAGPHTQVGQEKLQEAARAFTTCHKSSSRLRWQAYFALAKTLFHLDLLDESAQYLQRITNSSSSSCDLKAAALRFSAQLTTRREELRALQESATGKEATDLAI
ncbi:MAG: hypothetical protein C0514_07770 [Candidatus Puniceispirillum sp.]|nr:hypothetical protein [Candidatus Puniceispirillum sp.]